MVSRHHTYIAQQVGGHTNLIRDFDGMYRDVDDPHGQRISAQNTAHYVYKQLIGCLYDLLLRPACGDATLRYLDVGCGLGYFTDQIVELLRNRGQAVDAHGIDISATAVAKARAHASQPITFSAGSLLRRSDLGPLGEFDLVTCFETLYYFTDEEIADVVANLTRLVRVGRYVVLTYHVPESMAYGRYIQSLNDVRRWFAGFRPLWEMDFVDNVSINYNGTPFGRHLFAAIQRDDGG